MRILSVDEITKTVQKLCLEANLALPEDVEQALAHAARAEIEDLPRSVMNTLCENLSAARASGLPICQDTGMAVVFVKLGQEVQLTGGLLEDAVNEGVKLAYQDDLRCSVVGDPLRRVNTGDNTPAVLHLEMTAGDRIQITVAPKGFGSENMSAVRMLQPTAEAVDVADFVVETVRKAGANPCPPIIAGVGIGGTFEKAALLSKEALLLPLGQNNSDPYYDELEKMILHRINALDIGPAGFGGKNTALGVRIKTFPTHIAGLPVAVNLCCHVLRHKSETI